jgi:hypothetical protein
VPADRLRRWRIDSGADTLSGLLSFSADPFGDAYLLDFDGDVFRVVAATIPLPPGLAGLAAAVGLIALAGRRRRA